MLVHHLNCGSLRPVTPPESARDLVAERAVSHCLLIESDTEGLILVDTGIGSSDIARPELVLGAQFLEQSMPVLSEEQTAVARVRSLGLDPTDVRHVVLTHLDLDHAGGLADFPAADVHVSVAELRAAAAPGFHGADHNRYRPLQWTHQPLWRPFETAPGGTWFGLDANETPPALAAAGVRLIPLGGHSAGHTGVAVRLDGHIEREAERSRWALHAGDAYFFHGELDPTDPHTTAGLGFLRDMTQVHPELRAGTAARLRELRRRFGEQVAVFCAHDPWEFAASREAAV